MTVSSTNSKMDPVEGTGVAKEFPFSFKLEDPAHLVVVHTDKYGIETTLTLGTHYTVNPNADQNHNPGGSVVYPVAGARLTNNEFLTISRATPVTQHIDLEAQGDWNPEIIEGGLDKLTMLIQELLTAVAAAGAAAPDYSAIDFDQLLSDIADMIAAAEAAAAGAGDGTYYPDPVAADQADTAAGASLASLINVIGDNLATIVFKPHADKPGTHDANGRTTFSFYHPVIVPDNINIKILSGAKLKFDVSENGPGATAGTNGMMVLGYGGIELPSDTIFEDLTPFSNAVWWPNSVLNKVYLLWWGGNGLSTEEAAGYFKSAFATIPKGGTVILPDGTHLISSEVSVPGNMTLKGAGIDRTTILVDVPQDAAAFYPKRSDDVTFDGMQFLPGPTGNTGIRAIKCNRQERSTIKNVRITDIPDGIKISDCREWVIENLEAVDTQTGGLMKALKIYNNASDGMVINFKAEGEFNNNVIEIEEGSDAQTWAASTAKSVGNFVTPTTPVEPDSVFVCVQAGTTGSTEPDWDNPDINDEIIDGTAKWKYDSAYGKPHNITFDGYTIKDILEGIRVRECHDVRFNRGNLENIGQTLDGGVLFDIRWATDISISDITAKNPQLVANQEADFVKCYDVQGLTISNGQLGTFKRGVRLMDALCDKIHLAADVMMEVDGAGKSLVDSASTPIGKKLDGATTTGYANSTNIFNDAKEIT